MTSENRLTPEQQAEEDELLACCRAAAAQYGDGDVDIHNILYDLYLKEALLLLDKTRKEYEQTVPPFPFLPYAKRLIVSHIKLTAEEIKAHERSIPPLVEEQLREKQKDEPE